MLTEIQARGADEPDPIAQYLPPGSMEFDLLVVDEASQVRPEDALGAIARARQIVVVGDTKQLPPTSFFDRMVSDGGTEEEDGPERTCRSRPSLVANELESVLTLCDARGLAGGHAQMALPLAPPLPDRRSRTTSSTATTSSCSRHRRPTANPTG